MIKRLLIVAISFVLPVCGLCRCPVTTAPNPPFVPPAGYSANSLPGGFWYGTDSLWTWVFSDPKAWRSPVPGGPPLGEKLVYWRAGFDVAKELDPKLTVVARRLDVQAPLVWAFPASGVLFPEDPSAGGMAMMTGINLPTAGCWEIAARYSPAPHKFQTLSVIVLVEPNPVK